MIELDVERPPVFQRAHVFLRVVLLIAVGWIAHPVGILWLGIPAVAAILVAQKGGRRYLDEDGPTAIRILNWILDLVVYVALLTDRLPDEGGHPAQLRLDRTGSPTVGSALLRILYVIPNLLVLAILTFFGSIVWVVAVVLVLVTGSYPEGMWRFLLGIVRWEACVLAYLASLVDRYPPFALRTGAVSSAAPSAS